MIKILKNNPYPFWTILLILAISITGCVIKGKDLADSKLIDSKPVEKKIFGFAHKTHTQGGETTCKRCHMKATKSMEAGMPDERLCGFCHKTVYGDKPVGEFYNRTEWLSAHDISKAKYKEIKFSHEHHISMGMKCDECHGNVAESAQIRSEHIPAKPVCFTCHDDWNSPNQCYICHKEINTETPPNSHKSGNFTTKHGQIFREESSNPNGDLATTPSCTMCHDNNQCIKCHQETVPANHTNQWRMVGHGISAGIDRGKCTTCHKTDYCFRCHENTKPKSHLTTTWGNPANRHCQSCHLPLNSTNCSVCHRNVSSHNEEAPDSHVAGWGNPLNKHCTTCHTEAPKCSICHVGTPSHKDTPPSSHRGQWGSPKHKHCVRCHIPISLSIRCKSCHNRVEAHFSEAPDRPDNLPHTRALMCRACHQTGTPTLIHADDGLECRICHKI